MTAPLDYRAILPARGYVVAFTHGCSCPGCSHRGWLLGRVSAECARCATALPLAPAVMRHG